MFIMRGKKFFDKENLYSQRRSIGAFVSVILRSDGNYRTFCHVVEVQARLELICNIETGVGPQSPPEEPPEEAAAKLKLECPEITAQNTLENFIKESCKAHSVRPDLIIVYRDGVGDSQLSVVKNTEVKQVQAAAEGVSFTYLVVQKRIHTRFMVQKPDGTVGNPPPGTIVDKDLGLEFYDDFYLIPTKCPQSTVKPVHYILLHNDGAINKSELQQLTFTLCHCYPNWTDSIKLPFPTQLAHKLAYQMGESMEEKPDIHSKLQKTYFYL